jgi:hypothetical protein
MNSKDFIDSCVLNEECNQTFLYNCLCTIESIELVTSLDNANNLKATTYCNPNDLQILLYVADCSFWQNKYITINLNLCEIHNKKSMSQFIFSYRNLSEALYDRTIFDLLTGKFNNSNQSMLNNYNSKDVTRQIFQNFKSNTWVLDRISQYELLISGTNIYKLLIIYFFFFYYDPQKKFFLILQNFFKNDHNEIEYEHNNEFSKFAIALHNRILIADDETNDNYQIDINGYIIDYKSDYLEKLTNSTDTLTIEITKYNLFLQKMIIDNISQNIQFILSNFIIPLECSDDNLRIKYFKNLNIEYNHKDTTLTIQLENNQSLKSNPLQDFKSQEQIKQKIDNFFSFIPQIKEKTNQTTKNDAKQTSAHLDKHTTKEKIDEKITEVTTGISEQPNQDTNIRVPPETTESQNIDYRYKNPEYFLLMREATKLVNGISHISKTEFQTEPKMKPHKPQTGPQMESQSITKSQHQQDISKDPQTKIQFTVPQAQFLNFILNSLFIFCVSTTLCIL